MLSFNNLQGLKILQVLPVEGGKFKSTLHLDSFLMLEQSYGKSGIR